MAEGFSSASVAFVTLTYKETPTSFVYDDVQTMLKQLRMALWRKHRCVVRFYCAGERGDLFGRIHWHLLLFLSKPVSLGPWGKETHPGQLWKYWPHGWTTISNVDHATLPLKARYVMKYAIKGHGRQDLPRARMSLKPGIGVPYLTQCAQEWAAKGIVPNGSYHLPGIKWDRGYKAGRHVAFRIAGCARKAVADAWRLAWVIRYPGRAVPSSEWLDAQFRNDEDFVFEPRGRQKMTWELTRPRTLVVGEVKAGADGFGRVRHARTLVGSGWSVDLVVTPEGFAYVDAGKARWPLVDSVSEVLDLPGNLVITLDRWIRRSRGPQWMGLPDHAKQAEEIEKQREQTREFFRQHTAATVEKLRKRHGVAPTASGVYNSRYQREPGENVWARPGFLGGSDEIQFPQFPPENCGPARYRLPAECEH